MVINAENIAKTLGSAYKSKDGFLCCCPAHDDQNPSLSITDAGGGKILVHCFAGCSQEKVVDKLKELGLWPEVNIPETTYNYVDVNGNLIYQVVRFKDKNFMQRRPDGNGGWIRDLNGIEKLPYHLPELISAIKAGESIFIVEGEKDCETLAKLRLVATTNSGGAGNWSNQLSKYLEGAKDVFILPDNDETGRNHANKVAASLNKLNLPIKIVPLPNLPPKGDVSDWLAADGTKDQLLQLCIDASQWIPEQAQNKCEIINIAGKSEPDWADPATFGDPILFGEIETPELDSDIFAPWVKDFLDALAEQTQTPLSMAVLLELSILASILQKRFEVSDSAGDYIEPLSIWTATILPPANRKTAVLNALRQPLVQWEADEATRLTPRIEADNTEREIILKKIEDLKKEASRTYGEPPDDCSGKSKGNKFPEEIMNEIAALRIKMPTPPIPPKLFVTDITPEALQNTLAENGERLAILSDEGNIFEIMSGLYSDGKTNVDVFLQGHAGGPLRVKRSNRDVNLHKIAVSLGLAIQPQIIKELKFGSKKSFRGKGVLPRFLFCWPKSNIGKRDIRNKRIIELNVKQAYANGIKALLQIPPVFNIDNVETPRMLMLDDEASELWMQFSEWLEPELGEGGKFEHIQDWAGKLPGQARRIAGIRHVTSLADPNSNALSTLSTLSPEEWKKHLIISKITMEPVINCCKKLIIHTQAVFDDLMENNDAIADAKSAFNWILKNVQQNKKGEFFIKQSDLHNARFNKSDVERVIKALDILHGRNILSPRRELPTAKPTIIRYVNPAVIVDQLRACA